jgi:hypothetical protein
MCTRANLVDEFLVQILTANPTAVLAALEAQSRGTTRPNLTSPEILLRLESSIPEFVSIVRSLVDGAAGS